MRHALVVVALVLATAMAGCFDPFRAQVSEDALDASPMPWSVKRFDQEGDTFGLKAMETRYVHRGDDDSDPPFPGVLQVFSLRGGDSQDIDALEERTEEVLAEAIANEGIEVDDSRSKHGERRIDSGVRTRWAMQEGVIRSGGGDFFDPEDEITVRVLSEVGVDGRSKTGIIVIAFVKVAEERGSLVPGVQPTVIEDERTWFEVVGDPDGSIEGASLPEGRGLIYHLVTHD